MGVGGGLRKKGLGPASCLKEEQLIKSFYFLLTKLETIRISVYSVTLATFQHYNCYMWLVAAMLDSTDKITSKNHRKFYCTELI